MAKKGPGKSHRKGSYLIQLSEKFPNKSSAVKWFEAIRWPEGRVCGRCGSAEIKDAPNQKPMP